MSDRDSGIPDADSDVEVDEAVFGDPEALRALPPDRVEPTLNAAAAGGWRAAVAELVARGVVDLASGGRPLLAAAENGHLEVVTGLIGGGAPVGLADDVGRTPLLAAWQNQHNDVVSVLLAAAANDVPRF